MHFLIVDETLSLTLTLGGTMEGLFTAENLAALLTLTALEIVLGIDNIVFLAILSNKLPEHQQSFGRKLGLALAMLMRIGLLLSITWVMSLTAPFFSWAGMEVSGRDLIMILGGLFLIGKATFEIHNKLDHTELHAGATSVVKASLGVVVVQIVLIDIVFSFDSVITAVGMARSIPVMIAAIVIAIGVMFVAADWISDFIKQHPTLQMLALSFLILIGVMLFAEGFGKHIDRGYIYFAMGFSLLVEMLNIRVKKGTA